MGILAANYGMTVGATWKQSDFNYDGRIDVGDLGILAANYGQGVENVVRTRADRDYAKVNGVEVPGDSDLVTSNVDSMCNVLGLLVITGLALMGQLAARICSKVVL